MRTRVVGVVLPAIAAIAWPALALAGPVPEVRITSPLGRTGVPGRVRIVAQVKAEETPSAPSVRFFVDGTPVGDAVAAPPYAVEWNDENPFERREIVAELTTPRGEVVTDRVVLPASEVHDAADVMSVLLDASVYDASGRFVSDLEASAFAVDENGAAQTIDLVTRESVPATLALLVDNSQSMATRMDFVRRASERLASALRPQDRMIVAPFNTTLGALTGPTDDPATIGGAIAAMRSGGGTAILDSLTAAADRLRDTPGRRALIVLTDGYDENSRAGVDEALHAVAAAQITVYVVAIGGVAGISLKGERLLRRIADETGGRIFFPPREIDLASVADAVGADAHSRYLITYTPTDQDKDGRWRDVKIAVPDGLRVRSRSGYFADEPPPVRPTLEFTVTDAARRFLDVTVDAIEVVEDGVAQNVDTFHEAVDPVSIVMAIDASGSMKKSAAAVQQAARDFVTAVRPEDRLALILFADEPHFAHVLATDREWSIDAIGEYAAAGGTALYDALWNSLMHVKGSPGRRAVVVLTDGRDENAASTGPGSVHTRDEVLGLIKTVGAAIYPIGLGANVSRDFLLQLAALSGGEAAFPADVTTLRDEYDRVIESLRRRYVLSYTSTNSRNDGRWRDVQIAVRLAGAAVSSAGGYFAPPPASLARGGRAASSAECHTRPGGCTVGRRTVNVVP